jgi:hypothetical protein
MTLRSALRIVHAVAGVIAFAVIVRFLASSVAVELFGDARAVAAVKANIVTCLFILVPALIAAGATGYLLTGNNPQGLAARKLRRMKMAAPNGILVLIPAALFLSWKAEAGEFDTLFAIVQAIEYLAGSLNVVLLGLNIRDGLRMSGRLRGRSVHPSASS